MESILLNCENCESTGTVWENNGGWFDLCRCQDCGGYGYVEYQTTTQLYNLTRYFERNNTQHHIKLIECLKNKIKS